MLTVFYESGVATMLRKKAWSLGEWFCTPIQPRTERWPSKFVITGSPFSVTHMHFRRPVLAKSRSTRRGRKDRVLDVLSLGAGMSVTFR